MACLAQVSGKGSDKKKCTSYMVYKSWKYTSQWLKKGKDENFPTLGFWDITVFRYGNKNAENQPPEEKGTGVLAPIFVDGRLKIGM